MSVAQLRYLAQEIESFLPSGWSLADLAGSWDGRRGVWSVRVRDGADQEWRLVVKGGAAEKLGRLEALKRAIDVLYREALA